MTQAPSPLFIHLCMFNRIHKMFIGMTNTNAKTRLYKSHLQMGILDQAISVAAISKLVVGPE